MKDDKKTDPIDDSQAYASRSLDDEQEDSVDVTETDLENISDDILDGRDNPTNSDEITFSELNEEEEDSDDENNDVENLLPNIDEGTE